MASKLNDLGPDAAKAAQSSLRARTLYDLEMLLSGLLGSFRLFKRDLDRLGSVTTREQAEELSYSWDQLYNSIVRLRQTPEVDRDLIGSINGLEEALNGRQYGESARLAQRIDHTLKRQSADVAIELSRELTALVETTQRVWTALER